MGNDRAGCGDAGFGGLWWWFIGRLRLVRGDDRWHGKSVGEQFVFLVIFLLLVVILLLFFLGRHHLQ